MLRAFGSLLALVVVAGAYFLYPYWTLYRIDRAIAERDALTLEVLVDFPALRAALKADVAALMVERNFSGLAASKDGFGALGVGVGVLLGGALIDRMIESTITPHRLFSKTGGDVGMTLRQQQLIVGAGFASPTMFHVALRAPDGPKSETVVAVLELGSATWRVTKLILPIAAMKADPGVAARLGVRPD